MDKKLFFKYSPYHPLVIVILVSSISLLLFFRKGVNILRLCDIEQGRVSKQFDSYCKRVLSNSLKDIFRKVKREKKQEILFCDLSLEEFNEIYYQDSYNIFKDQMTVLGFSVYLENELLFEALETLKSKNCNVIVLAYWLGMNDYEIAEKLNIPRRTVTDIRNNTLKKIKRHMGEL